MPTAGRSVRHRDAVEYLASLRPVADEIGATIVAPKHLRPSDIVLRWHGDVVGGLRMPDLRGALARMIGQVERELGGPLRALSREDKQRAVQRLDERGAFALRKSVEDIADAMGVSRMTVYTYLEMIHLRDREMAR
jgi:HTH domain